MPSCRAHIRITVDFSSRHSSHDAGREDERRASDDGGAGQRCGAYGHPGRNSGFIRVNPTIAAASSRAQTHGSKRRLLLHVVTLGGCEPWDFYGAIRIQ